MREEDEEEDHQALMLLTPEQQHVVRIVILCASALSTLSCSYILWHHARLVRKRQTPNLTQTMVVVLSLLDFFYALPKLFGRAAIGHPVACALQGVALTLVGPMSIIWNCCMAHSVYRRVVCRDSEAKIQQRLKAYGLVTVVPSVVAAIYQLACDLFGDAVFYCWIETKSHKREQFIFLYLWVILAIVYVAVALLVTQAHIVKRAGIQGNLEALESSWLITLKLRVYIIVFALLWIPSAIFRLSGDSTHGASFPMAILMQATSCSQGFFTGVIYGGLLSRLLRCCRTRPLTKKLSARAMRNRRTIQDNHEDLESIHDEYCVSDCSEEDNERLMRANLFVTSFNMGEAKLSDDDMGRWIPRGYDIYVIGVQECLCLNELRAQIKRHIEHPAAESHGPPSRRRRPHRYEHFGREIGSKNTSLGYHGHIALSIFVRSDDVSSGAFFMPSTAQQKVNCGKSLLLFGRASNKGAVGCAFRYFDTSFAFVTCHLSSDSSGKSKVTRRNRDAEDLLQRLHLNVDDVGFEFPFMHHHSFVLGDLNYRLTRHGASPDEILELTAVALNAEREETHGRDPGRLLERSWSWSSLKLFEHFGSSRRLVDADSNGSSLKQPLTDAKSQDVAIDVADERPWTRWISLLQHDELTHLMQQQHVFCGFREHPIAFAPSYRRQRQRSLPPSSAWTAEELLRVYTTSVEGGGLRVPSYTDRILTYSQQDMQKRLVCAQYQLCEDVLVSDHKPVIASYHALVNRKIKPLDVHSSSRQSITLEDNVQRAQDLSGVSESVLTITFSSIVWKHDDHLPAPQLHVSVVFPLPSEDIFSEQRKLHEMAATMSGGVFHEQNERASLHSNLTTTSWTMFQRTGISHTTIARLTSNMHAAIKIDWRHSLHSTSCLGQGVLMLDPANATMPFRIELSVGGRYTGTLIGSVMFERR